MSSTAFRGREHRRFTPEEYLLLEDGAEGRHEYFDGEIFAMTGGSLNHNRIAQNLCLALRDRLADGPCETFMGDVRLHIKSRGLFTYPDLFVACRPSVTIPVAQTPSPTPVLSAKFYPLRRSPTTATINSLFTGL